jgi:hypothetical protein
MEPQTASESTPSEISEESTDLVELLDESGTDHPALERLHVRLNSAAPVEATITSYDRMHHRHNRQ